MLKKIFNNIELSEIIGLVILCFGVSLYLYFNPSTIEKSETEEVSITLSKKAEFSPATYDTSANLQLIDDNYIRPFYIRNCSLELINKLHLLKLNIGDKLLITVKKTELNSGKTIINNFINIYGIKLPDERQILNLNTYNSCKKNSWKKLHVLGWISLLFLLGLFIKKIRKE